MVLAVVACHGRPSSPAPVGIAGPSSAPVMETPQRAALIVMPPDSAVWAAVGREALELLAQYVRINTTNPPGNEIAAARWLREVLARAGIEAQILEPAPGKANLIARVRGDGSARPIILLNHMDVVEATPEFWTADPFGGVARDGYLYGRGAIDMKGTGVAQLMAMVVLHRAGVPLRRDIIFLATSDEEVGGLSTLGAQWIAREHPELVQGAEYVLNEGGASRADSSGNLLFFGIGTTEKAPFWLGVTAHGTAGHGSRPTPDNAVERLVRALARIAAIETPLTVTPAADRFFRDLATRESDPQRRAWMQDVRAALAIPEARRFFTGDLTYNAMLRNTISITRLAGSGKTNVIPPVARAELDVRLLPGEDPQAFLAGLRRVAADSLIDITPLGATWDATASSEDTELFRAIANEVRRRHPTALVTTPMLAGFTDSHYFRRLGITAYGFDPWVLLPRDQNLAHGND